MVYHYALKTLHRRFRTKPLQINRGKQVYYLIIIWMSYQIELEYRDKLAVIKGMPMSSKTKILLLETLAAEMIYLTHSIRNNQLCKGKTFSEALSTTISECQSVNFMNQKDIQELEEKIIKLRLVKIQNNEEVETMEEELFQMDKIVKARMEYNEYLKKKIDMQMQNLHNNCHSKGEKEKSVLNKSLGTVAEILKISNWWN